MADLIEDLLQGLSQEPLAESKKQIAGSGQDVKLPGEIQNPLWFDSGFPERQPSGKTKSNWFLGIDLGTTGISAVLLNRSTGQLYPVYWDESQTGTVQRRFRLPAVISFVASSGNSAASPTGDRRFTLPVPVTDLVNSSKPSSHAVAAPVIQNFKALLKLGIPYRSAQTQQWQPVLQWSDTQQIPLFWIQQAVQTLLSTLKQIPAPSSTLTCGALGLTASKFSAAIEQLSGVILGYPSNWSDTYRFNLREAVLGAGLVDHPEQVFLIEETIAALLSVLQQEESTEPQNPKDTNHSSPSPHLPIPPSPHPPQTNVILHNADWQGHTLILNAGATVTELALVNLPTELQALQSADFHLRNLPFAGDAIDQDIVCHLLYPLLRQSNAAAIDRVDVSLEAVQLAELELEQLVLPSIGEFDLLKRYRLRQRLESKRSGQILLDAARRLKLAFQQQSRLTLQLGDRSLTILRQDLGSRILLPYVQRLNRELNSLLQQTAVTPESVNQVICTGGTASIRAIGRWLHEKFPNAAVIQDTYTVSGASLDHCLPSCSRIAYGLAALPLHPQVLDLPQHQYSDYFLLLTLLHTLPDRPLTFNEIIQILTQQGIDLTLEPVRSQLVALLEGQLPAGLLPPEQDAILFTDTCLNLAEFKSVQAIPLYQKQGDYYHPDPHQRQQLQQTLATVLHHTHQKLNRPYSSAQLSERLRS